MHNKHTINRHVHIFLIYSFKNDQLECVSQMGLCEMRKVHLKKNDEEEKDMMTADSPEPVLSSVSFFSLI